MAGALLDPLGNDPVALTVDEYRDLRIHLDVIRRTNTKYTIHAEIFDALSEISGRGENDHRYHPLAWIVRRLIDQGIIGDLDESVGVLLSESPSHEDGLSKDELQTLQSTLKTLRAGGWFPRWLEMQVYTMATSSETDVKYPSPLQIAGTLADEIHQFQNRIDDVRDIVAMRPDLFAIPTKEAPTAPAPEPAKETSKPEKRSHAKRMEKANHAA